MLHDCAFRDLREVPALLRVRLEAAINEEASAATLNEHLPKIRPIILDLLRGLREKQDQHQALMAAAAERDRLSISSLEPSSYSNTSPQNQPPLPQPPPRHGSLSGQSSIASNYRARQQSSSGPIKQSKSREELTAAGAPPGSNGRISPAPSHNSSGVSRPSSRNTNHQYSVSDDGSVAASSPSEAQQYSQEQGFDANLGRKSSKESSARRSSLNPRPASLVKSRSSSSLRPTRIPNNMENGSSSETPIPPVSGQIPSTSMKGALPIPGAPYGLSAVENAAIVTPPLPRILSPSTQPPPPQTINNNNQAISSFSTPPRSTLRPTSSNNSIPLPPIPPGPDDAPLEALKKADPLARRASKRFSQYTYNKMTASGSMSVVGSPASTVSPLPVSKSASMERDDSAREFVNTLGRMDASVVGSSSSLASGMRDRPEGNVTPVSKKIRRGILSSPNNAQMELSQPVPPLSPPTTGLPKLSFPQDEANLHAGKKRVSMVREETEDQLVAESDGPEHARDVSQIERDRANSSFYHTQTGELPPRSTPRPASAFSITSASHQYPASLPAPQAVPGAVVPTIFEGSQESRTVYLQLGRDVKKAKLDILPPPSFASLRMLFTDRFAYNPGLADFPAIYLRDPISGVQYELEEVEEIKEHSVLSLNIERKYDCLYHDMECSDVNMLREQLLTRLSSILTKAWRH